MSKSEEIIQGMRDEGHIDAVLLNTVTAPLGSVSEDMFAVRFATNMPKQVQFMAYQASLTLLISVNGGPDDHVQLSPGPGTIYNIPPSTKHFYTKVKDVKVASGATYAMIVTAF